MHTAPGALLLKAGYGFLPLVRFGLRLGAHLRMIFETGCGCALGKWCRHLGIQLIWLQVLEVRNVIEAWYGFFVLVLLVVRPVLVVDNHTPNTINNSH